MSVTFHTDNPIPSVRLLRNPAHLFSLGFGTGLSPYVPGTVGTLPAIPIYLMMQSLSIWFYIAIVVVTFVIGVIICDYTTKALGVEDHRAIVWDEVVGYLITMIAAPVGWVWIVAGFFWFRLFDVVKPWPIGLIDRQVKGGLGIMLDDVLAGIYALLGLQLSVYVWSTYFQG